MTDDTNLHPEINETMAPLTPPPIEELIEAMIADLRRSGAVPGLPVGATAPMFSLPDAHGTPVALADRLADGPVVLSFYRGAWCPLCNIELRALQAHLDAIHDRGASLLAISPQAPDESLSCASELGLGFDVLSDLDQSAADSFRIRFPLSDGLIAMYKYWGLLLPEQNADGTWNLPVPATYVIDRSGIIRARHVDADYRQRMEPAAILAALDDIAT